MARSTMQCLLLSSIHLFTSGDSQNYDLLGEGECRQSDGAYPLKYSKSYGDLTPWNNSDNAEQATQDCEDTCAQYRWCYAAEVVLRDVWDTPECRLVTDRPTFESCYGSNHDYSWGAQTIIDDVSYQTYCNGGNPECASDNDFGSNWDGGVLYPRTGYWCYLNNEASNTGCASPDLLGEGECRQSDGAYPLKYSKGYGDLTPWNISDNAEQATQDCKQTCDQYSWCYAAEVVLRDAWDTPECRLVTDRPTFENVYGSDQDYSWGTQKSMDDVSYQTYCNGGNPECASDNDFGSNWDGGSLNSRDGYWCYVKPFTFLSTTALPTAVMTASPTTALPTRTTTSPTTASPTRTTASPTTATPTADTTEEGTEFTTTRSLIFSGVSYCGYYTNISVVLSMLSLFL